MPVLYGDFSGISSAYARPHINYSYTQNISANTTTITYNLYYERLNSAYSAYNYSSNEYTSNIDGNTSVWSNDQDFDLTGDNYLSHICNRTLVINHNADGTRRVYLGAYGNTNVSWGTYNFGQTITLPTIPREAYMSNPLSFTVGGTIPCTLVNTGNYYVKLLLYVNGTLIKTVNAGKVTSYTIDPTSAEDDAIYAKIPNSLNGTAIVRVKTFSDASYTTQIGSDKDKTGTASININLVKPIFTDWELTNTNEVIVNKDKYNNTLTTSNTNTLTNATNIFISGYNKPTATISVANKAIAQKSATMRTYNFELAGKMESGAYSNTNPVVVSIDDITKWSSAYVVAVDSRSATKSVQKGVSFRPYSPVTLYGMVLTRDNDVDSATKLSFSGTSYKGFFDLNNGADGGAENEITCHYRYKLTTESWGSQTWTEITATIGSNGEISFDDYINGDLGTSGFDSEKSYNIEVRAYDLLTNSIIEETLSKGTPVIDITQDGIAIKAKYNGTEGGSLQVDGKNIFKSSVLITGQTEDATPSGLDYLLTYDTSATGLKKASISNIAGIGSYNGFSRNCVINGNFEVWQRADNGTITEANILRTQDRWLDYATANGGTLPTLSRSKGTLTPGELPNSFYYTRLTTNGAGTSLGNSAYHIIAQNIEHALRLFGGQKVTLSFYARSSIANKKIGAYLTSSWGTGGSPSSAVITSGDAFGLTSNWTKFNFTFTLPSNNGKTFGTNNNDRVRLEIFYMWGSNLAYGFGETNAETYRGSGTIDITQVQLSLGDALLPFLPRSYQEEFLLCARYCYVPPTPASSSIIGQGTCALSTMARVIIPTPVPMYAVPTVTATYSDWIVSDEINSTTVTDIDPIAELTTNYNPVLTFTTAGGLTQFRPVMIRSNGANKKLILSAEI